MERLDFGSSKLLAIEYHLTETILYPNSGTSLDRSWLLAEIWTEDEEQNATSVYQRY